MGRIESKVSGFGDRASSVGAGVEWVWIFLESVTLGSHERTLELRPLVLVVCLVDRDREREKSTSGKLHLSIIKRFEDET